VKEYRAPEYDQAALSPFPDGTCVDLSPISYTNFLFFLIT